jgi:hypothetical protein
MKRGKEDVSSVGDVARSQLKRLKRANDYDVPQQGKDTEPRSAVETPPEAGTGVRPDEATPAPGAAATSDTASAVAALSMLHATPFDPEEVRQKPKCAMLCDVRIARPRDELLPLTHFCA